MSRQQPFWDYSLRLYPQVESWCLAQQENWGSNVNLLLFACFAGVHGHTLNNEEWRQLELEVADWNDLVVEPLRSIRQQMKAEQLAGESEQVRQQIKAVELASEQQVQLLLYRWWEAHSGKSSELQPAVVVSLNLSEYLARCKADESPPHWVVEAALAEI